MCIVVARWKLFAKHRIKRQHHWNVRLNKSVFFPNLHEELMYLTTNDTF